MTYIIAEIGINHNGSISNVIKLAKLAKKANADAIKIQTFEPEDVMVRDLGKAPYQEENCRKSIFKTISDCKLNYKEHFQIKNLCKKIKIDFLSSPFDIKSAKFLVEKLKIKKIKIPSGEITNYPLIEYLGKKNIELIISTGMSNIKEINDTLEILKKNGHKAKKTLLHCTTSYPTVSEDVNLLAIKTLKEKFKLDVGYSDHTSGYIAAIGAVCIGAKIIEKHFTLDNNLKGPDHKASLNPKNFLFFCKKIREINKMMGTHKKKIIKVERKNIKYARKSIVAKKSIFKGEKFSINNITTKRTGSLKSAMIWPKLIGKKSKKNYKKNDLI